MKLRWVIMFGATIGIIAFVIYRVSHPYLSGNANGSATQREFRSGTFRPATTTEIIP